MQIALIILKSGIELVTMAEQLEEEPSCHMQDPYKINEDGTLEPVSYTHPSPRDMRRSRMPSSA